MSIIQIRKVRQRELRVCECCVFMGRGSCKVPEGEGTAARRRLRGVYKALSFLPPN